MKTADISIHQFFTGGIEIGRIKAHANTRAKDKKCVRFSQK
jgi:hypothetical protein